MKRHLRFVAISAFFVIGGALIGCLGKRTCPISVSPYPDGKDFAFTVTDDPDEMRLAKAKPMYACLDQLGFRTTIACWVFPSSELSGMPDPEEQRTSATLEDPDYAAFMKEYKARGFEIALHTVTSGHDRREITIKGYERFREIFGEYPKMNIMHSRNKENIYWGKHVFSSRLLQWLVSVADKGAFHGEDPASPYFWGDVCRDKSQYVRLWGTSDINTLRFNPSMPYHDTGKPSVNYWFSFSDGYKVTYFNRLISRAHIDRLVKERGACIAYVHFAAGFCRKQPDGTYKVNDETYAELRYLAGQKEGWFVPAGELLDRLLSIKNIAVKRDGNSISFQNNNAFTVKGVTILTEPGARFTDVSGNPLVADREGEIILGDMTSQEIKILQTTRQVSIAAIHVTPGRWEQIRLVLARVKILLFSHRG